MESVNLMAVVAAAAGGICLGAMAGLVIASFCWRRRLELVDRVTLRRGRPAAACPPLWRDGWQNGR